MNYLSVENISKSFGERTLFKDLSFGINKDQKIAFIAKNGSGKTCIMKILNGEDQPDTGNVSVPNSFSRVLSESANTWYFSLLPSISLHLNRANQDVIFAFDN